MQANKEEIINQHEEYLNVIKNKSLDDIDKIVTYHIKGRAKEWLNYTEEHKLFQYFKK